MKKNPSFIRITYNKKILLASAAGFLVLLAFFLVVTISILTAPDGQDSPNSAPQNLTSRILSIFNQAVSKIYPGILKTPTLTPSINLTPTPAPDLPLVTPKILLTTNAEEASRELSRAILELKQEQLPSTSIERLYFEGKKLLDEGKTLEALEPFRTGYRLAQEILMAGKYYKPTSLQE
ncbi:hypothetical protein KJ596_01015 [Patescibacteria group bacterium]|nr:hypothetical protein [Patescibacteria group bacterium]MBU1868099.1 hypothetical protein [Patescibacteria group bacterium]